MWHSHITKAPFSLEDEKTNLHFAKMTPYGTISILADMESRKIDVFHISPQGHSEKIKIRLIDKDLTYRHFKEVL